jgi:hypothetical protein
MPCHICVCIYMLRVRGRSREGIIKAAFGVLHVGEILKLPLEYCLWSIYMLKVVPCLLKLECIVQIRILFLISLLLTLAA